MIVNLFKEELKEIYGGEVNKTDTKLKIVYPCMWERSSPYSAVVIGTIAGAFSGVTGVISGLQGTGNTYDENKKLFWVGSISGAIILGFMGGMGIFLSVGGCYRCEPGNEPVIVQP